MKIKHFQINLLRDREDVCFLSLLSLKMRGKSIDPAVYDLVHIGNYNVPDLEALYERIKGESKQRTPDRSPITVSDVIVVCEAKQNESAKPGAYYLDCEQGKIRFIPIAFDGRKARSLV